MHKATKVTITTKPTHFDLQRRAGASLTVILQHNLNKKLRDVYIYPDQINNYQAIQEDEIAEDNMFKLCTPEDVCKALFDIY